LGKSNSSSVQGVTPSRTLVVDPSITLLPGRAVQLTPLSICKVPWGTTTLEFVTSGRSVAISVAPLAQSSAATLGVIPAESASMASTNAVHIRANLTLAFFDIPRMTLLPPAWRRAEDAARSAYSQGHCEPD